MMKLFFTVLLWLLSVMATASQKPLLRFDGQNIAGSPYGLFVEELLNRAYDRQGYRIEYLPLPLARSFREANEGRLDGLRARIEGIESEYPYLVKVDYPLFDFTVELIGDRRQCGLCDLSQLDNLVTLRGFEAQQRLFASLGLDMAVRAVSDSQQALDMLSARRVPAVVLSGGMLPKGFIQGSVHWIRHTLAILPDYHYLHQSHAALAEQIGAELHAMESSGEIALLRTKHGIPASVSTQPASVQVGPVSAVSSDWQGYTDTEQGVYWKILRSAFASSGLQVTSDLSNWKRAKAEFAEGRYDILVGAYDYEVPVGGLRSDVHIDYELPVLAIGHDRQRMQRQIKGHDVARGCHVLGYDFSRLLGENIEMYEVSQLDDCMKMLSNGRLDMVFDYLYNLTEEERQSLSVLEISDEQPLFLVFQDTVRGRHLKRLFEQAFREQVVSGRVAGFFPDAESYSTARLAIQ